MSMFLDAFLFLYLGKYHLQEHWRHECCRVVPFPTYAKYIAYLVIVVCKDIWLCDRLSMHEVQDSVFRTKRIK